MRPAIAVGVGDQVSQHLTEAVGVGRGPHRAVGSVERDLLTPDHEVADHLSRLCGQIDHFELDVEDTPLHTTGGQQILDHVSRLQCLLVGELQQFAHFVRAQRAARIGHHFRHTDHTGQMIAQLVADHTDGLGPRRLELGESLLDR